VPAFYKRKLSIGGIILLCISFVMSIILTGYFQSPSAESGLSIAAVTYAVVIVCGAAGFGLIMYDILNTKTRHLLDEFKRHQTREDEDQKDK
jgi:FtsH-binding integral membrane protein